MVVINADRKTKAPKELSAIIEDKLSLAPYVDEDDPVSSLSTGVGMLTSGTLLFLEADN